MIIQVPDIRKGGTEFGVHYYEARANCLAASRFIDEDRQLLAASGMTFEQAALSGRDDDEGLATGTVAHAIMARLFQPDVFGARLDPSEVGAACRDEAQLLLPPLDKPWTRKADVRLARSSAGYAYKHLAPCLTDSKVLGAELHLRSELAGGPLTGDLDLCLMLGPQSAANMTLKWGGMWRPGLTILDWKFIATVKQHRDSTEGPQWLSYVTLGNRWAPMVLGDPAARVQNFAFACVQKTKAKVQEPVHDMILVPKMMDSPAPERIEALMVALQERGRADGVTGAWLYNHSECHQKFGRMCRFHPSEGGRCMQGLFDD